MCGQAQLIPETVFRVWKFFGTLHHTERKVVASTAHIWHWFETNTKENQFWSRGITMLVNSLLRIIIPRHTQHRYIFFRDWILGHAHPITKTRPLSCKHYFWDRASLCSTYPTVFKPMWGQTMLNSFHPGLLLLCWVAVFCEAVSSTVTVCQSALFCTSTLGP